MATYVTCPECTRRVQVTETEEPRIQRHWRATPGWQPGSSEPPGDWCPASGRSALGMEVLPAKAKPRANCPRCGREVAVTDRGVMFPHDCRRPAMPGADPDLGPGRQVIIRDE